MAKSSPQAVRPQANAASASRSMSITERPPWPWPGTALSVERDTSSRIDTARSRFCGRVCRQMRSSLWPVARKSTRARTARSGIKLVAVRVASGRNAAGTQSLELAFDGADTGARARIVPKRGRAGPGCDPRSAPGHGREDRPRSARPIRDRWKCRKAPRGPRLRGRGQDAVSAGWRGLWKSGQGRFRRRHRRPFWRRRCRHPRPGG